MRIPKLISYNLVATIPIIGIVATIPIIGIVATRLYDIKSLLPINFPLTTQIVKICESLGQ